jgi:hypothetical protein
MRLALPMLLATRICSFDFSRNAVARLFLATTIPWALSIAFIGLIYNSAGIAAGYAYGEHFPDVRYDNNRIVVQLLCG